NRPVAAPRLGGMADGDRDQLADSIRAVGADHAPAGTPPGDRRDPGAQSRDRLVPRAIAARDDRAAPATGAERVKPACLTCLRARSERQSYQGVFRFWSMDLCER